MRTVQSSSDYPVAKGAESGVSLNAGHVTYLCSRNIDGCGRLQRESG